MTKEVDTLAEMDQEVMDELDAIASEEESDPCSSAECSAERASLSEEDEDSDCDEFHGRDYAGKEVSENYVEFINHITKAGFEQIDSGSFRNVFARKNIVIKVPMNSDGEIDNRVEAAVWKKYKNNPTDRGIYLAPCRLLPNGCLMMGKCKFDYTEAEITERWSHGHWSSKVEGNQIGKYRNRMVAYDYALNVSERLTLEEAWGVHGYVFRRRFL